jgi:hypothetical protein
LCFHTFYMLLASIESERTKQILQMTSQIASNSIKLHAIDLNEFWNFLVELRSWNLIHHCR